MIVNFELLDTEPIKNVITSLNFIIDKTVYFGFDTEIKKSSETIRTFLKKYCGVKEVEFIKIPRNMLQETLTKMRTAVCREEELGNQIFFDLTGGDELPLVALGMLASETNIPMHIFNVEKGKLRELEEGVTAEISKIATSRKIPFDISMLVELRGGKINNSLHKNNKSLEEDNRQDLMNLISIFDENPGRWSQRSSSFNNALSRGDGGLYYLDYGKVRSKWEQGELRKFYNDCLRCKLIVDKGLAYGKDYSYFDFVSDFARRTICETGAVLELETCLKLKKQYGIAELGVHVDWNGILDEAVNVVNEVDVIALDGYVPIIVSCKCGKNVGLQTLYELETVAWRFGGCYARKVLISVNKLSQTDYMRAKEMGIEVRIVQ